MKICQKCDLSYEDDNSFCPKCGSPLTAYVETMFCPYCGKNVKSDMDFCPYCGKNLHVGTSYTNAPSSNVNLQDNYSVKDNNTHVNTNPSPSFDFNNCFAFIKDTPFIRRAIIGVIYVIDLILVICTEGVTRTYTENIKRINLGLPLKDNLTTGSYFLILLIVTLILAGSWFILNKLSPKAAKILKFCILNVIVVRIIFTLFGLTYGIIVFLIYVLAYAYYSKKKKED